MRSPLPPIQPNIQPNIQHWGLSTDVIGKLAQQPNLVRYLADERRKPAFSASYTPMQVELFYDDLLFVQILEGQVVYLRECSIHYVPGTVQVWFDDQLAMFLISSEIVVDRTIAMGHSPQFFKRRSS